MVDTPDFISVQLKELSLEDKIKIGVLSHKALSTKLINSSETKTKFNSHILPVTLFKKYFGSLLQDQLKVDYLNKLISNLQDNILLLSNT